MNLVSNAIKFTTQGEVAIRLECRARDDQTATLRFSVIDTGPGIPEDRIGSLFQDFVQVDSSINRRFGGSGLGLAISRRIIEQMGGSIGVESQIGIGSTFSFEVSLPLSDDLPLILRDEKSSVAQLDAQLAALIERVGAPLRILITDDNATNRLVAGKMLSQFAVEITEACDGLEAIEAVDRRDFDLILMDMQMPQVDGLTATASIRALGGRYATVPIIAFTANAFADDREACARAGMSDFVAKPLRKIQLLQAILRVLAPERATAPRDTAATASPIAAPQAAAAAATAFEPEAFATLASELDMEGAMETFQVFVADTEQRLAALAQTALDANRKIVEVEAHSIKSTAATFGFVQLSELARQLEKTAPGIEAADFDAMVAALRLAFVAGRTKFDAAYASAA
jgi:CheY-like chemotaxis protein/HPt (histidine-containing phosphotransfer) domain-containing protein